MNDATNINHTANAVNVTNGPLTTAITNAEAPGLLLNEIERRVTMIRPSATPLDQISRLAGARPCGSMVVDYYSVDMRPSSTRLKTIESNPDTGGVHTWSMTTEDQIFEESETLLLPDCDLMVSKESQKAVLYVVSRDAATGVLTVMCVNNPHVQDLELEAGLTVVRMGRAATELDVQTPSFEALPKKASNNCQIFKTQIEESTYQRLANKEVGWGFSDQEELAIMDMRMNMEKSFLFGRKMRLVDPRKREEVILTGGIWHQAGKDFSFNSQQIDANQLVDMMQAAFTGNAGSNRKILLAGTELTAALHRMQYTKTVQNGDVYTRWGIDFDEIHSKFGVLLVKHSEVFDMCGRSKCGLIIDPEHLTKYVHVPFTTQRLDLRKAGVRNTDAVVVTEASCLVLRYPEAHVRVTME